MILTPKEQWPKWLQGANTKNAKVTVDENGYVTWHNGTWVNGFWRNGLWKDGTWMKGTWMKGTWIDGIWKDGSWHNGTWKEGTWIKGVVKGVGTVTGTRWPLTPTLPTPYPITLPAPPTPPRGPIHTIIAEGCEGECPVCGSSLHRKFLVFKSDKCIHPKCENYYQNKHTSDEKVTTTTKINTLDEKVTTDESLTSILTQSLKLIGVPHETNMNENEMLQLFIDGLIKNKELNK